MATKYWLKAHKYHEQMNMIITELISIKDIHPEHDGGICLDLGAMNCVLLNSEYIPKEKLSMELDWAKANVKSWREEL